MEIFHRKCVTCLTGDFIRKLPDGDWIYPSTVEIMKKAKLIKEYVQDRQKQVEKHLFAESTPMTGIMNSLDIDVPLERVRWWKPIPIPNNTT
jgi:hypothetical protein